MKQRLRFLVGGFLGLMLAGDIAAAQPTNSATAALKSDDIAKRQQAIRELEEQRNEIIGKMVQILNGEHPDEIKQDAAKVLGVYRAAEAVEVLADNIELDTGLKSVVRDFPVPRGDFFPVSAALERIGGASIPHLMKRLSETDNKMLRGRCLSVCLAIEGREMTQLRLQRARDAAGTPEIKARLERALKALPTQSNPVSDN